MYQRTVLRWKNWSAVVLATAPVYHRADLEAPALAMAGQTTINSRERRRLKVGNFAAVGGCRKDMKKC